MTIKTDYRLAFVIPAAFVVGLVMGYFGLVIAGLERERVLDGVTISLAIGPLALLRGVSRVPQRTWPVGLGVLLVVLLSSAALALRSVSLAPSGGPLFYFTIVSSSGLGYIGIRILRRMTREAASGADHQPAPPHDGSPLD